MHDRTKLRSKPRRRFIRQAAGATAVLGASQLRSIAWAAGSAPEKKEVRIGFIPLTDCSSVVMASVMEFDKKYGIKIVPSKEASWAAVRDKLVNGELDAARLVGPDLRRADGSGRAEKDMAILMNLNHNGAAMTLSRKLYDKGVKDASSLAALIAKEKGEYTFAHFPTGTHAMWLYYWLATYGVHPFNDVKTITVPPPQMVANMRVGNMDGYCVGEPWPYRAIVDKIGFTAETTQGIWKDHPKKRSARPPSSCRKIRTRRAPSQRRSSMPAAGSMPRSQPAEDRRSCVRQILCEHRQGSDRGTHAGPVRQRHRQVVGRQGPHEVLQRRPHPFPVPVGRHVVPDPASSMGDC